MKPHAINESDVALSQLVTVIIPNYNHARYLPGAIDSILRQTYPHYEIIVVDDGSVDDSREVVAAYGDQVRYIYQENQGLSAARNTGIRAARGAYIGLLDADDMYVPQFLEVMVGELQKHPDAAGVYCGYQFVDDENRDLAQHEARLVPEGQLYEALLDGNFLVPESMLVRRSGYEAAGFFDQSLRACEDWDMWLRISGQQHVVGVSDVLTRHRVLPGSMSSDPIRMLRNRLAVLEKHLGPEPEEATAVNEKTRRAYGRAYLTSLIEYLQYGDPEQAYTLLRSMSRVYPELLLEVETFYELGCGSQPKGERGDLAALDVSANAALVTDMLARLFRDLPALQGRRGRIETTALHALGRIGYGARRFGAARRFLWRALWADGGGTEKRPLLTLYLKSWIAPLR